MNTKDVQTVLEEKDMRRMKGALFVACFAVAALTPALSSAAPIITIPPSDSLTIYGPNPAHDVLYQLSVDQDGNMTGFAATGGIQQFGGPAERDSFYYFDDSSILNPAQFANATSVSEDGSSISDIFSIAQFASGKLVFAFFSDGTGVFNTLLPGTTCCAINLPEGNGVFDATLYLDPGLILQGYTAQFTSDPGEGGVPEPASLTLLGTGLVAAYRARRKRTS